VEYPERGISLRDECRTPRAALAMIPKQRTIDLSCRKQVHSFRIPCYKCGDASPLCVHLHAS